MHETSMQNMAAVRDLYLVPLSNAANRRLKVIDIGALDVNGSYRQLFSEERFDFVGLDLEAGPGVDIVMEDPSVLPFADGEVDVILSGQMLEHGRFFWETFRDMMRVLSSDGIGVVIAPSAGPIHRYPVDCYRFYPDSLEAMADWAGVELIDYHHDLRGTWKDLVGVFGHQTVEELGLPLGRSLAQAMLAYPTVRQPVRSRYGTIDPVVQDDVTKALTDSELVHYAFQSGFWALDGVRPSAWTGHIPFMFTAFSLLKPQRYVELGTHNGGSLFGACQARERLGLSTECVAVDSWQGDFHAGFYDADVFEDLEEALDRCGYRFPILERTTFDEASLKFDPSSIDLLLIDGLHTYEAVKNDFETWLPKMAPGGLVMLHDTNVHRSDFGVWRLWAELQDEYEMTFEFQHAHGLGLVGIGGADSPTHRFIQALQAAPDLAGFCQSLYETVAERSESHARLGDFNEVLSEVAQLEGQLDHHQRQLADAETNLHALTAERTVLVAQRDNLAVLVEQGANNVLLNDQIEYLDRELRTYRDSKAGRVVQKWWRLRNRLSFR